MTVAVNKIYLQRRMRIADIVDIKNIHSDPIKRELVARIALLLNWTQSSSMSRYDFYAHLADIMSVVKTKGGK